MCEDRPAGQNAWKSRTAKYGLGLGLTGARELLNRYTVNLVSWVRIPPFPPAFARDSR
jgi:hypothetical protein